MADFSTPSTQSVGTKITAALWNELVNNIRGLVDADGDNQTTYTLRHDNDGVTLLLIRKTTASTGIDSVAFLRSQSTQASVSDGFGPRLIFQMTHTGGNFVLGGISAVRDGADTEGALVFECGSSGVEEFARISSEGYFGIGVDPSTRLEVEDTDETGIVDFVLNEDTTSTDGTILSLYRKAQTDDRPIKFSFDFNDSGGTRTKFGEISVTSDDVTDTSEDGKMALRVQDSGTLGTKLEVRQDDILLNDGALYLVERSNSHIETLPSGQNVIVYHKANKIIFKFNDSGTVRYKYLDLTGTGVTWTHTTSAP